MVWGETFFGKFADLSSFVVHDERVLQIAARAPLAHEDYMQFGGRRFALARSPSVSELESLDRLISEAEIHELKRSYVADQLNEVLWTQDDFAHNIGLGHALEFVIFEVLPMMIDNTAQFGLGQPPPRHKTGSQIIQELIQKETGGKRRKGIKGRAQQLKKVVRSRAEYEPVTPVIPPLDGRVAESVLGEVLGCNSVYVAQGMVFALEKSDRAQGQYCKIGDQTFTVGDGFSISSVEGAYQRALQNIFRQEAVEEFEEQFMEAAKLQAGRPELEVFAQRTEFQHEDIGFIRHENLIYVFRQVPKFAMKNPSHPNCYIPYPRLRVCARISFSDGQVFQSGTAFVAEAVVHPFSGEAAFSGICGSRYRLRGHTAEDVIGQIADGINVLINGLTMEGIREHEGRYNDRTVDAYHQKHGSLTRDEAMEQGYLISNEWEVMGRGNELR